MGRLALNRLDDGERRARVDQAGCGLAIETNVLQELLELQRPRLVAPRVLPARRLGRSHLGQPIGERESFETVASAEAVYLHLARAPVDFEREEVLPLGA